MYGFTTEISSKATSGLWFKVEDLVKNVYFALGSSTDTLNSLAFAVQMD